MASRVLKPAEQTSIVVNDPPLTIVPSNLLSFLSLPLQSANTGGKASVINSIHAFNALLK